MAVRGETIQQGVYLEGDGPKVVEMRNFGQLPNADLQRNLSSKQVAVAPQQLQVAYVIEQSWTGYFLHWVAFAVAMGINVSMWAIDYYAVGRQSSYYYQNSYTVSPYINVTVYSSSNNMFGSTNPADTLGIAMSLIYSWVLWKGPLIVYAYNLIENQEWIGLKVGTFIGEWLALLAADILLTVFVQGQYSTWIYYGIYVGVTLIVTIINNAGMVRGSQAVWNCLVPLLLIALLYVTYSLFLPTLYYAYFNNLSSMSAAFLLIYGYPAIDLLIYIVALFLGTVVSDSVKGLFSVIHYFMLGYGVGMVLMTGYTQVEFYYLIAYFIFRNVFVNHIMRGWQRVVANPPALPGWGIAYYLGYLLSFMPVIGVGKLVVAKSFLSYIYALTPTILYAMYNPLYASSSPPTNSLSINLSFGGNIFWLAGALIWLGMTFSQRYERHIPRVYEWFYYLVGIQLFYIGIACSLSVLELSLNAHL